MRFDSHLYVGEKAAKVRYGILQGLRQKKLQPEVYVITPVWDFTGPQTEKAAAGGLCDYTPAEWKESI